MASAFGSLSQAKLQNSMDIIIMRRGPAVAVLYSMYRDGTKPAVGIAELARKWDSRLAAALPGH